MHLFDNQIKAFLILQVTSEIVNMEYLYLAIFLLLLSLGIVILPQPLQVNPMFEHRLITNQSPLLGKQCLTAMHNESRAA